MSHKISWKFGVISFYRFKISKEQRNFCITQYTKEKREKTINSQQFPDIKRKLKETAANFFKIIGVTPTPKRFSCLTLGGWIMYYKIKL